jgi:hypothetical protein
VKRRENEGGEKGDKMDVVNWVLRMRKKNE